MPFKAYGISDLQSLPLLTRWKRLRSIFPSSSTRFHPANMNLDKRGHSVIRLQSNSKPSVTEKTYPNITPLKLWRIVAPIKYALKVLSWGSGDLLSLSLGVLEKVETLVLYNMHPSKRKKDRQSDVSIVADNQSYRRRLTSIESKLKRSPPESTYGAQQEFKHVTRLHTASLHYLLDRQLYPHSDLVISKESFPSKALMEFLALVRLFCKAPSCSSFCAIAACRYRTFSGNRKSGGSRVVDCHRARRY